MKYLVTGGSGFIGSNIVGELLSRGEKVRILDNFSTGNRKNIEQFKSDIELLEGDIRSLSTVYRAADNVPGSRRGHEFLDGISRAAGSKGYCGSS